MTRIGAGLAFAALLAASLARADGQPAAPSDTYLAPNTQDSDGTAAYVRFDASDMPLRVSVDMPRQPARYSSSAETREAVIEGLRVWERALQPALPWFRLAIAEDDPYAHVRIKWKRRMTGDAAGRGGVGWSESGGVLRTSGSLQYTTQTCLAIECTLEADELTLLVAHEFGHALGLGHCLDCDSIMNYSWETRRRLLVTDVDVRTFQALGALPNGRRVDGGTIGAAAAPR